MIIKIGNITVEGNEPEADLVNMAALAWLRQEFEEPSQAQIDAIVAQYYLDKEAREFDGLPEWAAYTTTEAVDAIHAAILAGDTLAQAQAKIDALPNTVAGMKTGLKSAAAELVAIRGILEKIAKVVVYLRDRTR